MRKLSPALKDYFDARVSPILTDPTMVMITAARVAVGVTNADKAIVDLFRGTVAVPNGESWCEDFLQACISFAEDRCGVTSPLPATEGCLFLWNDAKAMRSVKEPIFGDIIIWQHGETALGHCGFILGSDTLRFSTVEGNTSDSSGIDRSGGGVFLKSRARGGTATFKELGFLRPFGSRWD